MICLKRADSLFFGDRILVIFIGAALICSHLLIVVLIAQISTLLFPNGAILAFLPLSVLASLLLLKLQNRIEAFFIAKHLKKNPCSGWSVVVYSDE